jgi:hypothetical protein
LTVAVSPEALPVSTAISPGSWPALVLNADYRPLSYYPLSLWSWQDTIKAVFLDRVTVVSTYDKAIHSPSFEMRLPSVVSLKTYVKPSRNPAFTRFNVFLAYSAMQNQLLVFYQRLRSTIYIGKTYSIHIRRGAAWGGAVP